MLKALMKKQFRELGTLMVQSGKKGKRRSKIGLVLYTLLFLYLFGVLAFVFTMLSDALHEPLHTFRLGWLYFALMGLIATLLSIFGSVFATYSTLYHAKDNELLLSMPIPVWKILFVRMACVYVMSFVFEIVVLAPASVVHWIKGSPTVWEVVFEILIWFVLPLLAMTLSCFLGWIVGLLIGFVGKRFRNFAMLIAFVAIMALYYYGISQAPRALPFILKNIETFVKTVKTVLFPLYHMGYAAEGDVASFFIMLVVVLGIFGVTCFLLSRSFFHIAATQKGDSRVKFQKKKLQAGTQSGALLRKEMLRFTGSATYMMNCGLGTVVFIIAAVFMVAKGSWIQEMLLQVGFFAPELLEYLPILLAAVLCLIVSMNDISAPSVSLEGKNIWILQSMPISGWQILKGKMGLHILVTGIPAMICTICAVVVLQVKADMAITTAVVVPLYVLWCAELGIVINLKLPNLSWTSEAVVVKQGLAVLLALLGNWAVLVSAGVIFFFAKEKFAMLPFLGGFGGILLMGDVLLFFWLKRRGCQIFENLQAE